ncbi:XRE family transcriptional regulator [Fictibacillus sp. KIGAM418]|uniref:XRE family transcriptional regulator n=1 Tax=Fictibacillus marinisediminis TaxID=2878389 RepID=A0A9X1X999_9BACL|nr:XRE family transcriptional regulator [Fictibacillus marinisediminis]MCK6255931.1 XRE family transcriptional regulator [Fictibacillus marinisediminis]
MNLNEVIGRRLKAMRGQRNWSLEKTANATGVSKPMLSQIERGESNPTVSTLWKIANGLGVSFSSFLEEDQPAIKKVNTADVEPIADKDGTFLVRPLFPMEPGKSFEIYSVELLPGCHYTSESHGDGVEEYILVEKGCLSLTVHQNYFNLSAGENIRFAADYVHVYENQENDPVRITMMIYYP